MSARERRPRSAPRAAPPRVAAIEWPAAPALAALGAIVLLALLAPPARNLFWGVNALRSLPALWTAALLAAAALGAFLAWRAAASGRLVAWGVPLLAAIVAFPLREKLQLLGDTSVRFGAVGSWALGVRSDLAEEAVRLHAQPLDAIIAVPLTAAVSQPLPTIELALSIVSFVLGVAYLAGLWAATGALAAERTTRAAVWLAAAFAGVLLAFAGYPESAGVLLAAAVWWWAALFAPLGRPRAAWTLLAAWVLVWLAHRLAFVLVLPMLVRALGPAHPGDEPSARRLAAVGTVALAALAAAASAALGTGLGGDLAQLLAGPSPGALESLPSDLANLLLFAAPLAVLAALVGGARAWRAFAAAPRAWTWLAAVVPLLPMAFLAPVLGNGLGVQRDWDLAALPALGLTLAGAALLAECSPARRRGALVVVTPLLVVLSLGGVMVNAHEPAARARAEAMAEGRPRLGPAQRASVLLWLGGDRLLRDDPAGAARALEASWQLAPTPARGSRAALAWLLSGDPAGALRMTGAVRANGRLDAGQTALVDTIESKARLLQAQQTAR